MISRVDKLVSTAFFTYFSTDNLILNLNICFENRTKDWIIYFGYLAEVHINLIMWYELKNKVNNILSVNRMINLLNRKSIVSYANH